MHGQTRPKLSPIADFGDKLSASLRSGTLVRLILSGGEPGPDAPEKVLGRRIDLRGTPHLSLTFRYAKRDEVHNLPLDEAVGWVLNRVPGQFRNALLGTTERDWQLTIHKGKGARLISHKPLSTAVPASGHDRARQGLLDDSARDWLVALGITDQNGRLRAAMSGKYSQINRYLEIFSHLAREGGWLDKPAAEAPGTEWTIADMGAGKGYLTFGLWHLCRRVWGLPVQVLGIEARPDLISETNRVAAAIGAQGLRFVQGNIESAALPSLRTLIALHACNTATDHAIRRGIALGAQLIVLAPCCHQELRPQLGNPAPLAGVLRHGIMAERMAEWATDGMRALFLEWAGYQTKSLEFVPSEHTPKNLMIVGVKCGAPFCDASARARLLEFRSFFGIQSHTLDPLLNEQYRT